MRFSFVNDQKIAWHIGKNIFEVMRKNPIKE